ncbi:hypothetical protein IPC1147_02965 [Pseudomonas aeruginosa]|uniref:hypothetical protein n=1 Tax=Pseudomonas aeruginosa TaxID=287 RepID=UPI000FFE6422|nr:hypothetical protein [Pseudomonas aeruginosa]MDI3556117.1 hypothetical protein [Pseudomonas aeruginosa]RRS26811.1 hypothetical protein IPC1107_02965 [Pseudomonas aeruginosa]RRS29536.1 hypothetical protein IPC1147_02965 [Pseudomonas aeruginosa]
MKPLRVFAAVFLFAGILAGCVALLLLVIVMVRFPPLLLAVLLACWMFCRIEKALAPETAAAESATAPPK